LHELLKDTAEAKTEVKGEVNIVQGQGGWRTPNEAWMEDGGEEEEEVHFVNMIQVDGVDSDENWRRRSSGQRRPWTTATGGGPGGQGWISGT
jgi:hypothetical protein